VSARQLLVIYRMLYAVLLVVASLQTALGERGSPHLVALALTEIAGVALLCEQRTQWAGLALLLSVFALAQLHAGLAGEWPTRYLQYALSALFIVLLDRSLGSAHAGHEVRGAPQ
jgi:hypothetical protein